MIELIVGYILLFLAGKSCDTEKELFTLLMGVLSGFILFGI